MAEVDIETTLGTIVQRLDGKVYKLEEIGIITRDFNPSSPSPKHNMEEIEGRHGAIDLETVYEPRKINCSFYLKAYDMWDYALLRDEVFKIFDSRQPFYIIDARNPGKRWRVKCNGFYDIEQQRMYGFFDIEFIAFTPFAESIGTTLSPFTFDSNLWQIGQGLIAEDTKYIHNTTSFRIFNAGDELIDPKRIPFKIQYIGASKNLSIRNVTTGDVWSYTGESASGNVIELNGVKSTKNGTSIFGATNWGLITLKPGWNDFVLAGTSGNFEIKFDFRFYYL